MRSRLLTGTVVAMALACVGTAHATAQMADRIELDGTIHRLTVNPLDVWLEAHPDVTLHRLPGQSDPGMCSANWRGYLATFTIVDRVLMLDRVVLDACTDGDPDARTDLVPLLFNGRDAVPVDWFDGVLVVPTGELVEYVHLEYGSLYASYRLFRVEGGRVTDEARMDARQYARYRKAQFAAWQKTDEYRARYGELVSPKDKEEPWTPGDAEGFLFAMGPPVDLRFALPFDVVNAAE